MSWVDDLQARAEQSIRNATNSIGDYLDNRVSDAVVVKSAGQNGNLSALEIAQGQRGGQAGQAGPKAAPNALQNAIQASGFVPEVVAPYVPMILAAAALYLVFSRKGRN